MRGVGGEDKGEVEMHRERAGIGSKVETGAVDRKRINDAPDKHMEKSPPLSSRGLSGKDKDKLLLPSTSAGKQALPKNKCSDGKSVLHFSPFSLSLFHKKKCTGAVDAK